MGFNIGITALVLATVTFSFAYAVGLCVYNKYFHPLSRFPGPLLWTMSKTPANISLLRGNLAQDIHAIHMSYGPVVRIDPNTLSFVTENAKRDIYNRRVVDGYPMPKDPGHFPPAPNGSIPISSAAKDDHIRLRKALAHGFSEKALLEQEPLIRKYVDQLMVKLESAAKTMTGNSGLDIGKYFNWTIFDIFGDLAFGDSFDCLVSEQYQPWTSLLPLMPKAGLMAKAVRGYGFLSPLLALMFIPRAVIFGAKDHWKLSVEKINQRVQRKTDRKDIMSFIVPKDDNRAEASLSIPELEANGYILIFAGAETTASALSAAILYLIRHPGKFVKLKEEIRRHFSKAEDITFQSSTVTHLPYMHAVLQETFRIAPPVAGHSPRVVPRGGGVVDGEAVPEGAIIGIAPYAAHRYPPHFAFADSFIPERWLAINHPYYAPDSSDPLFTETTFLRDHRGAVSPFNIGPMNCIGMNLAMAELRLILALLVWHFDVNALPGVKPLVWETQKTYNNWQRVPMKVILSVANPVEG